MKCLGKDKEEAGLKRELTGDWKTLSSALLISSHPKTMVSCHFIHICLSDTAS